MDKRGEQNSALGLAGERAAASYLQKRGFSIVAQNYRARTGEIDLIVCNDEELHFVEVKSRRTASNASPLEQVTYRKQRQIIRTAQNYLARSRTQLAPVFSVMAVTGSESAFTLEWVPNAFGAQGDLDL